MVCLTHDIDFIGLRKHRCDHTMFGFLYRAVVGSVVNCLKGRAGVGRLVANWKAALSLPFVHLGWVRDFWVPFPWYLETEKGLGATYYFIPFKRRAGEHVAAATPNRRASAYDVSDIPDWIETLKKAGCELGVHGIDAWHDAERGRAELDRVAGFVGESELGIRMHWLLRDKETFRVLEKAGYTYDSTVGYNETPGYRAGTSQVYRPPGVRSLLELPMHIQDGALFYSNRLNLSDAEAETICEQFISNAKRLGGVLTLLWHDRSHAAERFWGDFYAALVRKLRSMPVWFGTAAQIVKWFRQRREVFFEWQPAEGGLRISGTCSRADLPDLIVRTYTPGAGGKVQKRDLSWNGSQPLQLNALGARKEPSLAV